MKNRMTLFMILFLFASCSLKTMSSKNENESKLADDELEFSVDNPDEIVASNESSDEEEEEETPLGSSIINSEDEEEPTDVDQFMSEVGATPAEPKFEDFKVAVAPKPKEVQEYKIDTPMPLAVKEEPVSKPKTEKAKRVLAQKVEEDSEPVLSFSEGFEQYQVQSGDTLMMIGFKLFGDYRYWRELKAWNNIKSGDLKKGMVIKYKPLNDGKFVWRPNGLPHLVKKGEYLGSISYDKYGTSKKWKQIFDNNRPLLRNPNLIFAGFTIYYVPEKRGVASEN